LKSVSVKAKIIPDIVLIDFKQRKVIAVNWKERLYEN